MYISSYAYIYIYTYRRFLYIYIYIYIYKHNRLIEGPLGSAQIKAIGKGWQGVWQPAMNTGKHGRSGGVATLVIQPILMIKGGGEYNHRWHRVMVQWTRRTKVHIVNIYGKERKKAEDNEQNHKLQGRVQQELQGLGRVPWIIGGDWNQEPGKVTDIWEIGGEIARTGTATHELGGELDWFMLSLSLIHI